MERSPALPKHSRRVVLRPHFQLPTEIQSYQTQRAFSSSTVLLYVSVRSTGQLFLRSRIDVRYKRGGHQHLSSLQKGLNTYVRRISDEPKVAGAQQRRAPSCLFHLAQG